MNNIDKRILIINDVTGYGRVSSFAMMPIMTAYGLHPYVLPTALVSNTMDYGESIILDTTQFMRDSIEQWNKFGFTFPVISTGLINSSEQLDIICKLITDNNPEFVLVDPIMADDGKLYPGMYDGAVKCYRKLIALSDLVIPNYTEATLIADMFTNRRELSMEEFGVLVEKLRQLGAKDIVITGCRDTCGKDFNLVYDSKRDELSVIEYSKLPASLIGTGDVFSAALLSELLRTGDLNDSVRAAADLVRKVVIENTGNSDNYDIHIERTIQEVIYEIRQR